MKDVQKILLESDSIIFDLDGTLWDSSAGIIKAWSAVLAKRDDVNQNMTYETLREVMGMQIQKIGAKLFPNLEPKVQAEIMNLCIEEEERILRLEGGLLYPDLEEVLKILTRQYPLFIVSNCQKGYIETFLEHHRLGRYFQDFECAGNTGLPKGDNIRLISTRNQLKSPVYIGDTKGDEEATKSANVPFIYASYGFGDVNDCEYRIDSLKELIL